MRPITEIQINTAVKFPRSVHRQLKRRALDDGVTIQAFVVRAVERALKLRIVKG